MKTNDLEKGDRVQLRNGWYATIADNMRGNTRLAAVEGHVNEIGSVYSHDIIRYLLKVSNIGAQIPAESVKHWGTDTWELIEHTKSQLKLRANLERLGW